MMISGRRESAFGAGLHQHEKGHGRVGDAGSEHAEEGSILRPSVRLPRQVGANRQDSFLGRERPVPVHHEARSGRLRLASDDRAQRRDHAVAGATRHC